MKLFNMEYNEVIKHLASSNKYKYNLIKTCEELAELQEVLLKRIVKEGGPKSPPNSSIIEEIGDVQIRLDILKEIFGSDKVTERINQKSKKYISYIEENKYIGTI